MGSVGFDRQYKLIEMKENNDNKHCLIKENNFLYSVLDFAQMLTDNLSFSSNIKEILRFTIKYYEEHKVCFYFIDNRNNRVLFFWIEEDEIQSKVIINEKLTRRIKNIKNPCIRKRSIFQRKNLITYYFPFRISNFFDYMIELPIVNTRLDPIQVRHQLEKMIPIIKLSLKNFFLKDQLDLNMKETVRILNSIPSGIASINSKGIFLFANQMFEMMTGYTFSELRESYTIINRIFPDFSFVMLESQSIDGRIFKIRRKDNSEFPCLISITQVTEGEDITLILTLNDDSYNIRQKEEILNLRKTIANDDNVGAVLFRFSSFGGEIVIEDLRNMTISTEYFLAMFYTSIGQGNRQAIGVFGPIPAPKIENYSAIIFAFFGKDDLPVDHRMKGKQYYLLSIIFPDNKTEFLVTNKKINQKFNKLVQNYEFPNRMNIDDLTKFREIIFMD